ncbi:MAG: beta-propeller domain-containing protein [Deltaproteobacteria bacterium]|nr:beta-propeller domain-containing protein [Deltaproteobacteria bacterium]
MTPRALAFVALPLCSLSLGAVACGSGSGRTDTGASGSLRRFGSESELVAYLEAADAANPSKSVGGSSSGGMAEGSTSAGAPSSDASGGATSGAPANETITNNQELGVDEGGIVKNIGSSLVVLRKGRLYAVSVAQAGQPSQTDSLPVAPSDALNQSVWYDEMLVRGDRIYVIGYRYGLKLTGEDETQGSYSWHGATEVSSFRLGAGGKLERLKTLFLESNDYFSGSNYASRMIDGKLVFYMPHGAWRTVYASGGGSASASLHIPRYFTANPDGTFTKGAPIFTPTDVYVPLDVPQRPLFHTVVKCELPETGDFSCQARSLLSSWGREHYVTPGAVFLWSLPRAYMFRFEDLGVVAHRSAVSPRDQFSFKAKDDVLHIVGTEWRDPKALTPGSSTKTPDAKIVVESLPLGDFDVLGDQSLASKSRTVEIDAKASSWIAKNRFVGNALFLGLGAGYVYDSGSAPTAKPRVVRFELQSGATTTLEVAGQITRIEPMGEANALVAIQASGSLELSSLPTSGALAPAGSAKVDGLTEGESRSHGFFFKPASSGGGAFGLPVLNSAAPGGGGWYGGGVSNIGFWQVSPTGALSGLGVVSSSKETGVCEVSCVDWYGNTRPVFLGERAFALMGSELAEIAVAPTVSRVGTPAVLSFAK